MKKLLLSISFLLVLTACSPKSSEDLIDDYMKEAYQKNKEEIVNKLENHEVEVTDDLIKSLEDNLEYKINDINKIDDNQNVAKILFETANLSECVYEHKDSDSDIISCISSSEKTSTMTDITFNNEYTKVQNPEDLVNSLMGDYSFFLDEPKIEDIIEEEEVFNKEPILIGDDTTTYSTLSARIDGSKGIFRDARGNLLEIGISNSVSGDSIARELNSLSESNIRPDSDHEYLKVIVSVRADKLKDDSVSIKREDFTFLNDEGKVVPYKILFGVDNKIVLTDENSSQFTLYALVPKGTKDASLIYKMHADNFIIFKI